MPPLPPWYGSSGCCAGPQPYCFAGILPFLPVSTPPNGSFISQYNSIADLQAIPTVGLCAADIGKVTVPVIVSGVLKYFQLEANASGVHPNDYNATTNNVSWQEVS